MTRAHKPLYVRATIAFRVSGSDKEALKAIAKKQGLNLSQLLYITAKDLIAKDREQPGIKQAKDSTKPQGDKEQ